MRNDILGGLILSIGVLVGGCSTIKGIFNGDDKDDKAKCKSPPAVSWMPGDVWHHSRGAGLVEYGIDRGICGNGIEWHPSVQGGRDRNDPNPLPSYPEHARAWNKAICDAGGVQIVFLLNMNQRYAKTHDVEYFRSVAREAKAVLDPKCTWIEPTVEPHDEGNIHTNEQKYAAVAAEMAEFKMIMPASCGGNGSVNPTFPNQRFDFLDCHPRDKGQAMHWLGPAFDAHRGSLLVITDGGDLLNNIPGKLDQFAELANFARARNRMFVAYTDRYAPGDDNAHRRVIDALAGAPAGEPPPPPSTSIEERSPNDGPNGFLWKPAADHSGNLVVLLPPEFNNVTKAVELHRALPPTTETVIEGGRYTGIANGNRGHWRYNKPGGSYGGPVVVLVIRNDGSRVAYRIPNGADRTD